MWDRKWDWMWDWYGYMPNCNPIAIGDWNNCQSQIGSVEQLAWIAIGLQLNCIDRGDCSREEKV